MSNSQANPYEHCKLHNTYDSDKSKNYYRFSLEDNKKFYKNVGYDCSKCGNTAFTELMSEQRAKILDPYLGNAYNLKIKKYPGNTYGITCYDDANTLQSCCSLSGKIDMDYDKNTGYFKCNTQDLGQYYGRCGPLSGRTFSNQCNLLPDHRTKYDYGPIINRQNCLDTHNILNVPNIEQKEAEFNNLDNNANRPREGFYNRTEYECKTLALGVREGWFNSSGQIVVSNDTSRYKPFTWSLGHLTAGNKRDIRNDELYQPWNGHSDPSRYDYLYNDEHLVKLYKPKWIGSFGAHDENLIILSTLMMVNGQPKRMFLNCTEPSNGVSTICLTDDSEPLRLVYNYANLTKIYRTKTFANGGNLPVYFSRYDHSNAKYVPFVTNGGATGTMLGVSNNNEVYTIDEVKDDYIKFTNGKTNPDEYTKLVCLTTNNDTGDFVLVAMYAEMIHKRLMELRNHRNGKNGDKNAAGIYHLATNLQNRDASNNSIIMFETKNMIHSNQRENSSKLRFAANFIMEQEIDYTNKNRFYGFHPNDKFKQKGFTSLGSKVNGKTIYKYLAEDNTNPTTQNKITIKDILNSFAFYQPDLCSNGLSFDYQCPLIL